MLPFTFTEGMILIISIIVLVLSFAFIILCVSYKKMKRTLEDNLKFMYQLMRQNESTTNNVEQLSKTTNTTNETLSTLTSSIRSVMKKMQHDSNEKMYPGPQMLELIDKCITENILMQATLIQNDPMPENSLVKVSNIVTKTFPHIYPEYIIQRTTYIMEEFNKSQSGRKAQ